jgi:MFS transporter, MHS family, alpha-ketoglutarate permease
MQSTLALSSAPTFDKSETLSGLSLENRRRSLKAAAVGNVLEWYDWTIYGTLSIYLAANFFQKADPASALLSTLAIFAGGFVARPIGGLVFGRLADRSGRKLTLLVTMLMLAAASLGIALLPTYESIGAWASLGLFSMRLLQGFAHGGESGVSYVYIAEIAPDSRRGLWTSSIYVSVIIGVMLATGVAASLTGFLSPDDMMNWGWRIGFGLGSFLGLYVLFLRRNAHETDAFESLQKAEETAAPAEPISKAKVLRFSFLIIALNAAMNVWYYTWVAFAPAMVIAQYKMDPNGAFIASLLAQACTILFLPVFGMLSDRVGRRPMMIVFAVLVAIMGMPISSILTNQPWTLFVAQSLGLAIWTVGVGHYPALMAELVPARVRGLGVSILTSLAVALFGGTAPYLMSWTQSIQAGWVFSAYQTVLAVITIIAALMMKETKGMDLKARS